MTVDDGQQLLHYRLIAQIGEGGMGAVWKARDTTLDRAAAIETLPPAVAGHVRMRSIERVASAVSEGLTAVQFLHQCLAGPTGPIGKRQARA